MLALPTTSRRWFRAALLLGGSALVLAAAIPGRAIERAAGADPGALAWGPALFRLLLAGHGLGLLAAAWRLRTAPRSRDRGESEKSPAAPPSPATWWTLGAISLAALALRLWHLDSGLWHDEIGTLIEFVRPDPGAILTSFRNQNQHMLYSLAAHGSIALFGESAAALRLPAALFGVACVPALFLLARAVVTTREALLACGLMAASYHHIWFSQNARGYTGVLFFTLLATWLWLEAQATDERRYWAGYVAAVALGMWVHLSMAFVVAAHGLASAGTWIAARRSRGPAPSPGLAGTAPRGALAAYALSVTVTAQLYALGMPAFFASGLHEVSLDSEWIQPLWLLVETARGLAAGFSGPTLAIGFAALAAAALVGAAGWWSLWRRHPPLAVVTVLPGVLLVGLMIVLRHNLWPRFLFFCAGFGLLILVHGAFVTAEAARRRGVLSSARARTLAVAGVSILIVASLASLPRYYALPKQDYAGAMRFVDRHLKPDGAAVSVGLARVAYDGLYAVERPGWRSAADAAELEELRDRHSELWLVYSLPTHLRRWHPDIWRVIETDFEEVEVFPGTLRGGDVRVLRARAVAAGTGP